MTIRTNRRRIYAALCCSPPVSPFPLIAFKRNIEELSRARSQSHGRRFLPFSANFPYDRRRKWRHTDVIGGRLNGRRRQNVGRHCLAEKRGPLKSVPRGITLHRPPNDCIAFWARRAAACKHYGLRSAPPAPPVTSIRTRLNDDIGRFWHSVRTGSCAADGRTGLCGIGRIKISRWQGWTWPWLAMCYGPTELNNCIMEYLRLLQLYFVCVRIWLFLRRNLHIIGNISNFDRISNYERAVLRWLPWAAIRVVKRCLLCLASAYLVELCGPHPTQCSGVRAPSARLDIVSSMWSCSRIHQAESCLIGGRGLSLKSSKVKSKTRL